MDKIIFERINENPLLKQKLERIMTVHECPNDHICLNKRYEEICEVCPFGDTILLSCIQKKKKTCQFSYQIGGKELCECEIRILIQELEEN